MPRLSGAFVRTVTKPGRYGDGGRGSHGLALLVKPTTTDRVPKSWVQRIRVNGRSTNIGLGPYPLVTLAQAREVAIENTRAVRTGADPQADRKRKTTIPTFAEAAERVIALYSESWKDGSRTARIWRSRLAEYVYPAVGRFRIDELTTAHVLNVLTPIWATRRETARKVRQYLNAVMAWAVAQGYREDNPAAADVISAAMPRAGNVTQHHRALGYTDVPAALAGVQASNAYASTKDALAFLVLTAARSGEVRGATWTEIDLDTATWTIPGARMKTGREHRVPLSSAALEVLHRAHEYADSSGLLFPSIRGRALSDNTLSKLLRDNGVLCVPHGFRSTFRVWAAECSSAPREIAEMALAHVEGSAAELAYRRTDYFEARRSLMEEWAKACQP